MRNIMKKSDIKNGMHVITNDGTEYVIISGVEASEQDITANTIMVQFNANRWMPFDGYDENLHYHDSDSDEYDNDDDDEFYDIKTVYVPRYYSYTLSSVYKNPTYFTKVWERPIAKKMTKAEIEKELGYEIEIID